ncbi:UDP-N-acetylmuramoyl-L-alanyl-D-glutamate--2,6-diaminopimelate ligase [Virgibacillus salinus]|uniref:UDP-N-acetylmuramyl-tripeptide synthetase n=1 Tax=Virgibacillus salinus TaxID=553311 RepID=A0A1H1B737_9BACI|nr:UDP-N-acetylmuramoyl-L-alanyl-D-glutamate--2,6-diaminopimelate ligase [Virgibacillus salinus]SDQ47754.1 UDP-N-acetylmuramoylalanyl-D-glutamate--2,6-diaminopimelate ligase [Virgibacillus salinus]
MNTQFLLSALKVKQVYGTIPNEVIAIEQDSRQAVTGCIFICTTGFTFDGHDFYKEALENGASIIVSEKYLDMDLEKSALVIVSDSKKAMAILANRFFDYPSTKMTTFGVTGTNGKTTVTNLIYSMLREEKIQAGLSGTNGITINDELKSTENTTCDTITNQRMLKSELNNGISHMIMEVSSHGIAQGRLNGIDFDIVTFTNLSHDHLDFHGTMEQYGYTKGILFAQLGNDLTKSKYIVLNYDDPWFETYKNLSAHEVISYGLQEQSDFYANKITFHEDFTEFTLHTPEGTYHAKMRLLGTFNIYNAMAAIASLYANGSSVERLVTILQSISPISGRLEKLDINAPVTLYLDYAHTPNAIESSIQAVLPFKTNRLIYLAGTGGDRDDAKRPLMAEKASKADYVILTINDPRYENTEKILRNMEKGMQHDNYFLIADRKEAITYAIEISEPGDILIFAGKGQENYQIIENTKQPYSDTSIIKEVSYRKYKKCIPHPE